MRRPLHELPPISSTDVPTNKTCTGVMHEVQQRLHGARLTFELKHDGQLPHVRTHHAIAKFEFEDPLDGGRNRQFKVHGYANSKKLAKQIGCKLLLKEMVQSCGFAHLDIPGMTAEEAMKWIDGLSTSSAPEKDRPREFVEPTTLDVDDFDEGELATDVPTVNKLPRGERRNHHDEEDPLAIISSSHVTTLHNIATHRHVNLPAPAYAMSEEVGEVEKFSVQCSIGEAHTFALGRSVQQANERAAEKMIGFVKEWYMTDKQKTTSVTKETGTCLSEVDGDDEELIVKLMNELNQDDLSDEE